MQSKLQLMIAMLKKNVDYFEKENNHNGREQHQSLKEKELDDIRVGGDIYKNNNHNENEEDVIKKEDGKLERLNGELIS